MLFDGVVVPLYMCEKPYSPPSVTEEPAPKPEKKKRRKRAERKED
jgi:hypothetical protein